LFGIFQRMHSGELYSGTGIGLAIVRKAAERMHGEVGLSSEAGHGSNFWVELPGVTCEIRCYSPARLRMMRMTCLHSKGVSARKDREPHACCRDGQEAIEYLSGEESFRPTAIPLPYLCCSI